jgi:hypothetical protein
MRGARNPAMPIQLTRPKFQPGEIDVFCVSSKPPRAHPILPALLHSPRHKNPFRSPARSDTKELDRCPCGRATLQTGQHSQQKQTPNLGAAAKTTLPCTPSRRETTPASQFVLACQSGVPATPLGTVSSWISSVKIIELQKSNPFSLAWRIGSRVLLVHSRPRRAAKKLPTAHLAHRRLRK